MNRPGSVRFPVIMMSVSARRGVCAALKRFLCLFKEQAKPGLISVPTHLDVQASFWLRRLSFPAQEDDDVARVSEAVTKAVVCAIKSAESGDATDAWLNPTEVALIKAGIILLILIMLSTKDSEHYSIIFIQSQILNIY